MVEKTNSSGVLLASAARTAAVNSDPVTIRSGAAIRVFIDVTADPASAAITPTIQGQDPQGDWYTVLTGAQITGVGKTQLIVCPGCAAVTNEVADVPAPSTWRLSMAVADTDSMTYSAHYEAYVL